ncbi:uncharacterized protein LOC144112997 isoform X3 [Amblyomma americanum]
MRLELQGLQTWRTSWAELSRSVVMQTRHSASPGQDSSHLSHCMESAPPGMGNHQGKPAGKNLHECTHCNRGFKQKADLVKHLSAYRFCGHADQTQCIFWPRFFPSQPLHGIYSWHE